MAVNVEAPPTRPSDPAGLEYSRLLFDNIIDWYKSADTKAQVILTLDGVLISFVTSTVFSKRDDLDQILAVFSTTTWVCLSLMALSIVASVAAALSCLWSRLLLPATVRRAFHDAGLDVTASDSYRAEFLWFFQHLQYLHGLQVADRLRCVDTTFEIEARATQIVVLSRNVTHKHWAVNAGFTLFGIALILFVMAASSYLANL